jgi:hypothetical protein
MKTHQEKIKLQILTLIKRSGIPVQTQYIADRIAPPERLALNGLLTELVNEKRLRRSYTLLVNGDPACTYDIR